MFFYKMPPDFSIESNYHNNIYRKLILTYFFGGVMPRIKTISISLIMFFLVFILCLGTMAQAQPINNQNCKNIAKKMMGEDIRIKKIHKQITSVVAEANGPQSKNYPRIDRFNRHVNILIHNLGSRVGIMKGLIEEAKQQGNNCQEMARKISGNVDAMQEIYVNMGLSLENPDTSGRKLSDLNKNLEQQANGANSELKSAVKSF
jgi:hypothetical protein